MSWQFPTTTFRQQLLKLVYEQLDPLPRELTDMICGYVSNLLLGTEIKDHPFIDMEYVSHAEWNQKNDLFLTIDENRTTYVLKFPFPAFNRPILYPSFAEYALNPFRVMKDSYFLRQLFQYKPISHFYLSQNIVAVTSDHSLYLVDMTKGTQKLVVAPYLWLPTRLIFDELSTRLFVVDSHEFRLVVMQFNPSSQTFTFITSHSFLFPHSNEFLNYAVALEKGTILAGPVYGEESTDIALFTMDDWQCVQRIRIGGLGDHINELAYNSQLECLLVIVNRKVRLFL